MKKVFPSGQIEFYHDESGLLHNTEGPAIIYPERLHHGRWANIKFTYSNGIMYLLDDADDKVYAYDAETKGRLPYRDFNVGRSELALYDEKFDWYIHGEDMPFLMWCDRLNKTNEELIMLKLKWKNYE